jgi:hypothetical protein
VAEEGMVGSLGLEEEVQMDDFDNIDARIHNGESDKRMAFCEGRL